MTIPTTQPSRPAVKKTPPASRPVRRTQEQRSSTTQAVVIEAAINCLHRLGYAATSTTLVAKEAGVSRGAMVHQFPAKSDLMLAVVRAVFEQDGELHKQSIQATSPRQWMRNLPETMWGVISRPSGIAVIEIMLASRSDPALADELRAVQQQIDSEAHVWVLGQHVAAGIDEHPKGEAIHRLFVAAVRGLALEQLFMRNEVEVKKSIGVLSDVLRLFYPELET